MMNREIQFLRVTPIATFDVTSSETDLLADLQNAVGGYIERVHLDGAYKDYYLIVNEEGLLEDNPVPNYFASLVAKQPIYGSVALIKKEDFR